MGAIGGGGMPGMGGGGPLGAMGMDMSMHKMPIIGGFFQNPAELHKQEQFSRAGQAYSAYRPEMAQARMNALGNAMSAYQPAMNTLAAMNGGKAAAPQMGNPMGPSMMQQGSSMTPGPMAAKGQMVPPGIMGDLGMSGGLPGGMAGMGPMPGMGGGGPSAGGMMQGGLGALLGK
jgi:hypothetical protein